MIALWMLYVAGTSALLAVAARAAETVLRSGARATRWVWVGALLGSIVLPVSSLASGSRWTAVLPNGGAGDVLSTTGPIFEVVETLSYAMVATGAFRETLAAADGGLIVLWIAASLLVGLVFARTWRRVNAARQACIRSEVDGERVLLSREWGPAAIGIRCPEVVIPQWLLREAEEVRRLIILHEREHVRAGDHALLALMPLVAVALPWNPAVWWQLRRLRLAVEVDCDHRVLSRGVETGRYGSLLIDVAGRSRTGALAPAMASSRSTLEHRIVAMTGKAPRHRMLRSVAATVVIATCLAAACDAPTPAEFVPDIASRATTPVLPSMLVDPDVRFELDGKPVAGATIRALDPETIRSVEVIKRHESGGMPENTSLVRVTTYAWAAANGLASSIDAVRPWGDAPPPLDLPEDAVFEVDGRRVDRAMALALEPDAIERVEIMKRRSIGVAPDISSSLVRITTK